MEPILCFPAPPPAEVQKALETAGYGFVAAPDAAAALGDEPEIGYTGAVISGLDDLAGALEVCRAVRKRETPLQPLLLLVGAEELADVDVRDDLFDDFIVGPSTQAELDARLSHLLWRTGRENQHDLIVYGPLALNLETYQAVVAGRPLDLTFMEYELLRFLAAHPGSVFTREVLLSRVWGYEYFGGARTVDVHIRRLRAKLGEEHAHLIETVRSVGYRFGRVRWSA